MSNKSAISFYRNII